MKNKELVRVRDVQDFKRKVLVMLGTVLKMFSVVEESSSLLELSIWMLLSFAADELTCDPHG